MSTQYYMAFFTFYILLVVLPLYSLKKQLKVKEKQLIDEHLEHYTIKTDLEIKINHLEEQIEIYQAQIISSEQENEMLRENFKILKEEIYGKKK